MKKIKLILLCLALVSCSKNENSSSNPALATALPASWYSLSDTAASEQEFELPSAEADAGVRTVFQSHQAIMDLAAEPMINQTTLWHLDGMRTDFSISMNGVFGFLLLGGTSTVRATWQKLQTPAVASIKKAKISTLHFSSQNSAADVDAMLEPVLKLTMSNKPVAHPEKLKVSLQTQAHKFFALTQALASVQSQGVWQVTGAELQLTVDASGNVTPVVGVGGEVDIYFDWNISGIPKSPVVNPGLTNKLNQLVQALSRQMTLAMDHDQDLKKSGFHLSNYWVSVELAGTENIGVVSAGEAVTAKLLFGIPTATTMSLPVSLDSEEDSSIPIMGASPTRDFISRLQNAVAISASVGSEPKTIAHVPEKKFQQGLKRAFKMANYFITKANEQKSKKWKLTVIETEFDASLGGRISASTVAGTAGLVLDFTPNDQ